MTHKESLFVSIMTDTRDGSIIVMHARRASGDTLSQEFDNYGAFALGKGAALDLAQKLRENAEKL